MSAVKAVIHAGVCGFVTEVKAEADEDMMVRFDIASPCENIQGLAQQLGEVDAYREIGAGFDGEIHRTAHAALKGCCSGCVIPNGIFKSMQIAAGLALPRDVSIEFEKAKG